MLIAFCGIDGSGKTTQIEILKKSLENLGENVVVTKQPTNWYRQDIKVRKMLNEELDLNKKILAELALFSATDRMRHTQEVIIPELEKGNIVISDRYVYSAYSYFLARGLEDIEWLKCINKFSALPDLIIYVKTNPRIAYERIIARDGLLTKKEETNFSKLEKVSSIFENQPWGRIENYVVVDGIKSKNEIAEEIFAKVSIAIKNKRRYNICS